MTSVFGWWDLDPHASALVNRLSGERVQFRGPVAPAEAPGAGRWWRFAYRHERIQYPVLVELTQPNEYARRHRRYHWRIDHRRSAEAWRREANRDCLYPPFGLWRRIDDCVTDALICWPAIKTTGKRLGLSAIGGWLNSTWHDGFERVFEDLGPSDRKRAEARQLGPAAPFMMPIDQAAPARWQFHEETPTGDRPVEDAFPGSVFLSGVTSVPEERVGSKHALVVPEGVPLAGYEQARAYMMSEDGERVLFPAAGVDKATSAALTRDAFRFTYADPDLVFSFSARNRSAVKSAFGVEHEFTDTRANWKLDLIFRTSPLRRPQATPELSLRQAGRNYFPSPALWRRVSWAVTDAWLFWPGTEVRSADWPAFMVLAGVGALTLSGRCVAGMPTSGEHCRITCSEALS